MKLNFNHFIFCFSSSLKTKKIQSKQTMTEPTFSETSEMSDIPSIKRKILLYSPPPQKLTENKVFNEEFVPYKILLDSKNKEMIHHIVVDHMLFNSSTTSVDLFLKQTGLKMPDNHIFYQNYSKITDILKNSNEYTIIIEFIHEHFDLKEHDKLKIQNLVIQFLFLKKLKQEGGQKTFFYFKEMRKTVNFELNPSIFSLVGYTEIQTEYFKKMVSKSNIHSYINEIKSILWNEKFKRPDSLVIHVFDEYIKNRKK